MAKRIVKYIVAFFVIGSIFSFVMYVFYINGDAFKNAQEAARKSKAIDAYVGGVVSVKPDLTGDSYENCINTRCSASVALKVIGNKKTVKVNVNLNGIDNNWTIEKITYKE